MKRSIISHFLKAAILVPVFTVCSMVITVSSANAATAVEYAIMLPMVQVDPPSDPSLGYTITITATDNATRETKSTSAECKAENVSSEIEYNCTFADGTKTKASSISRLSSGLR